MEFRSLFNCEYPSEIFSSRIFSCAISKISQYRSILSPHVVHSLPSIVICLTNASLLINSFNISKLFFSSSSEKERDFLSLFSFSLITSGAFITRFSFEKFEFNASLFGFFVFIFLLPFEISRIIFVIQYTETIESIAV